MTPNADYGIPTPTIRLWFGEFVEPESRCGECGGRIGADYRCEACRTLHNGPDWASPNDGTGT